VYVTEAHGIHGMMWHVIRVTIVLFVYLKGFLCVCLTVVLFRCWKSSCSSFADVPPAPSSLLSCCFARNIVSYYVFWWPSRQHRTCQWMTDNTMGHVPSRNNHSANSRMHIFGLITLGSQLKWNDGEVLGVELMVNKPAESSQFKIPLKPRQLDVHLLVIVVIDLWPRWRHKLWYITTLVDGVLVTMKFQLVKLEREMWFRCFLACDPCSRQRSRWSYQRLCFSS